MCVSVCMCVCVCVCVRMWHYVLLDVGCTWVHLFLVANQVIFVYISEKLNILCRCVCVRTHVFPCVFTCVYAYTRMCVWMCVGGNIARMDTGQKFNSGRRKFVFIAFVGQDFLALTSRWTRLAVSHIQQKWSVWDSRAENVTYMQEIAVWTSSVASKSVRQVQLVGSQ